MYSGKIGKFLFEHDTDTNRISVYIEGQGVEPVSYINVSPTLNEKDFHYEIMDFVTKRPN